MLDAARIDDIGHALEISAALLRDLEDCPYLLVWHSILIRLEDSESLSHTLDEAEQALLRAHSVDKSYLPALEELAHYYDAIRPDPQKARTFAAAYIEQSGKIVDGMRAILEDVPR